MTTPTSDPFEGMMPFSAVVEPAASDRWLRLVVEHRNGGMTSAHLKLPTGVATVTISAPDPGVPITMNHDQGGKNVARTVTGGGLLLVYFRTLIKRGFHHPRGIGAVACRQRMETGSHCHSNSACLVTARTVV